MFDSMYAKIACPKCGYANYVYLNPDFDDMSVSDEEGCRCWKCKHEWVFDEFSSNLKTAYITDGEEHPFGYGELIKQGLV